MEKENKDIIENTENTDQTENDSKENNRKSKNRFGRVKAYVKKHPYRILMVMLLCIALFFILRETGVISKHVYEKVENMGEREGVCFDNLLFSYTIGLRNISNRESEYKYLCIFNTGDIYCFEWSELYPWNVYYDENYPMRGYDDTNWEKMENVVYLGRLSNWQTSCFNQYVQNFDPEGEYFDLYYEDPYEGQGSGGQNEQSPQSVENVIYVWRWKAYSARIYWHEQPEKNYRMHEIIESCTMDYLFGNIYEKGEISLKSYDENAIAALKLFESSLFYYRWVFMCLHS